MQSLRVLGTPLQAFAFGEDFLDHLARCGFVPEPAGCAHAELGVPLRDVLEKGQDRRCAVGVGCEQGLVHQGQAQFRFDRLTELVGHRDLDLPPLARLERLFERAHRHVQLAFHSEILDRRAQLTAIHRRCADPEVGKEVVAHFEGDRRVAFRNIHHVVSQDLLPLVCQQRQGRCHP